MGRLVLSSAVWRVEDRRTLAWQKEEAGAGLASPPSHTAAISRQFPQGQLFPRVSCSPLLCCSTPGRGPGRFHLFKL